jgi:hypothetical protein
LVDLDRAEIGECGVHATAIVPNLNVFKYGGSRQCVSGELVGRTFSLKRSKETFSKCVVKTISKTNLAQEDVTVPQAGLVRCLVY